MGKQDRNRDGVKDKSRCAAAAEDRTQTRAARGGGRGRTTTRVGALRRPRTGHRQERYAAAAEAGHRQERRTVAAEAGQGQEEKGCNEMLLFEGGYRQVVA